MNTTNRILNSIHSEKSSGLLRKFMASMLVAISCCLAPSATAGVIFHDDFAGPINSAPNPTYWTATADVVLTGSNSVTFGPLTQELFALDAYAYAPGVGEKAEYSFSILAIGAGNHQIGLVDSAHSNWTNQMKISDDIGTNTWVFTMSNTEIYGTFDMGIGRFDAVGDWKISWALDQVVITFNSNVVFDTAVNAPIEGGSWAIPTVALAPKAIKYTVFDYNTLELTDVTYASVPEPATMALLLVGGIIAYGVRRKQAKI